MSTLLKTLAWILSLLSPEGASRVGRAAGLIWFYGVRIRRRTVLANLRVALPERRADRGRIARAAYCHFGETAVELLRMSRMSPDMLEEMVSVEGMAHYEAAAARNRGVIVVTAHQGNFDLLAASQAARGIPLAVVSRSLRQRGANRFWMETRRAFGLKILADRGGAAAILRHLRRNGTVALTTDQRTRAAKGGIPVPFMGVPAMTGTAAAALAVASGAALLPVHIEREGDGRHRAFIEPEIVVPSPLSRRDVPWITSKINEIVGSWVSKRPEQYMWLHRRFVMEPADTDLSPPS